MSNERANESRRKSLPGRESWQARAGAASSRSRSGSREIGHLHGNRTAHFGFPKDVWAGLFEQGRIDYHPVFPGKPGYAARRIDNLEGFSLRFSGPRFNEFVVRGAANAVERLRRLAQDRGIDGGIALSRFYPGCPNDFLVCVTEVNTREEIDALVDGLVTLAH